MPLTPYQSGFDLDTLKILQNAFDQAWAEVAASPGARADEQAAHMIATRIVEAWRDHGERCPEQLKRQAIEGGFSLAGNCPT